MRRLHTPEQKAEAVRELLGSLAIPEGLGARYRASESEIRRWLEQASDGMEELFQAEGHEGASSSAPQHQAILSEYELKFLLGPAARTAER